MTTKQALDRAMGLSAAHTQRLRQLLALSAVVPQDVYTKVAGQHPGTLPRDIAWAEADFQRAKKDYETHCAEINEPAYATYNED